ncbi:RraA family protein [Mangrovicoccus algicola]|uniref:Putative 4-hydroxy-4-methyl-2-oxoglutarate aldolase n=1 Tax=Mangrovicoccus algicola TaxID=2771008 RepID=A0A8J6YWN7_9RHOB|nr:RraA family protein [Mangrovicoccus algicola]MBE3639265.1 RraA family protein [Mangrovicoccus algicola]
MYDYAYTARETDAIERLKRWYSGDVHDSMEALGLWGFLDGISLQGSLAPGAVIVGPAVTVLFAPSDRKGEPQDVYHNAIDNAPAGAVMVVDAACADGSCSGELMSTGAKTAGLAATVVNSTVRDLAQVRDLGYPLFGTAPSPVGITGKKEPKESQVPLTLGRTVVKPGDVIFGDIDGVVSIPREHLVAVADQADELGAHEAAARRRILSGEKLQSVWPVARADGVA